MHPTDTQQCFMNHMGLWLCRAQELSHMAAMIQQGILKAQSAESLMESSRGQSMVTEDGIAVISLMGPLMKGRSKFGGTSTVATRQALRAAANDDRVKAILLAVDSPGGHVAGTKDLADEVAAVQKPVYAQVDDMAASAALWIAAQADELYANATAMIGSIGTYAVIYDQSERYERDGVKVHVVSTGKLKGAGVEGLPVSKDSLKEMQEIVDGMNAYFLQGISDGRDLPMADVEKIADGRVWLAEAAMELGLIDGVQTLTQTMQMIRSRLSQRAPKSRSNTRAKIDIALAESRLLNELAPSSPSIQ